MTQYRYGKLLDVSAPDSWDRPQRLPRSLVENARLEEDRRQHDRADGNRRQSERAIVDGSASLSVSLAAGLLGQLYNLSAHGCSIQLSNGSFQVGEAVWFRIVSMEPWKGIVRWVSGENVGVEFDEPFYPAAFDLIVNSGRPISCSKAA